ncbi:MAG: hypothetical protein E7211_02385 [Clostridium lundense]|nr:hypothetical protein [Clostridium lundense]
MNKATNNKITENQYMALVQSSMIAIGILTLSRGVAKYAHQDAWISVIIGGIYPIIVVIMASFIDKKMNHNNFWQINKELYGKYLSYIIILIFIAVFSFSQLSIISGYVNVIDVILVPYLPKYVSIITIMLLTLYTAISGLNIVARLCEIVFYLSVILIVITLLLIFKGNVINIMPFFSSFKSILAAIPDSLYSYAGIELSYVVISFITNKKNTKKSGVYGVLTVIVSYTINVFVTIWCIGWEMTAKYSDPSLFVASSVEIPLIENARTIIMIIWSLVIFRILACELFASSFCLYKATNISYKKSCVIITALLIPLSFFLLPERNRIKIVSKVTPYLVIVGLAWGIITSITILIKKRNYKEEIK